MERTPEQRQQPTTRELESFIRNPEAAALTILRLATAMQGIDLHHSSTDKITSAFIGGLEQLEPLLIKKICTLAISHIIELPWQIDDYMNGDDYTPDRQAQARKFYALADKLDLGGAIDYGEFYEQQDELFASNVEITEGEWETIEAFCEQITQLWLQFSAQVVPGEMETHIALEKIINDEQAKVETKLSPFEQYMFVVNQMRGKGLSVADTRSVDATFHQYSRKIQAGAEMLAAELSKRVPAPLVAFHKNTTKYESEQCLAYLNARLEYIGTKLCGLSAEAITVLQTAAWRKYVSSDREAQHVIESFLWQAADIGASGELLANAWLFLATCDKITQLQISLKYAQQAADEDGIIVPVAFLPRKGRGIPFYADEEKIYKDNQRHHLMLAIYPKLAFNMLLAYGKLDAQQIFSTFQDLIEAADPSESLPEGKGIALPITSSARKEFAWVDDMQRAFQNIRTMWLQGYNSPAANHPYYLPSAKIEEVREALIDSSPLNNADYPGSYFQAASLQAHLTINSGGSAYLPISYIPGYAVADFEIFVKGEKLSASDWQLQLTARGAPVIKLPRAITFANYTYKLVAPADLARRELRAEERGKAILSREIAADRLQELIEILDLEVGWHTLAAAISSLKLAKSKVTLGDLYNCLRKNSIYADVEIRPFLDAISDMSYDKPRPRKAHRNTFSANIANQTKCYIEGNPALTCFEAAELAHIFTVYLFPELEECLFKPHLKESKDGYCYGGSHTALWVHFQEEALSLKLADTTPSQHALIHSATRSEFKTLAKIKARYPQIRLAEAWEMIEKK
jgi:hypothetical protein